MKQIVLTDLDHTITDAYWRDPMIAANDWDAYHAASVHDKPIEATVNLLRSLEAANWLIVGCTARPGKWQKMSMEYMFRYSIPMHELLMRPDEDFRPSPPMKLALVADRFGPDFAEVITFMLEDREDVTAAFRAAGVTVLQVHNKQKVIYGHR
jgi:hypothetical protein